MVRTIKDHQFIVGLGEVLWDKFPTGKRLRYAPGGCLPVVASLLPHGTAADGIVNTWATVEAKVTIVDKNATLCFEYPLLGMKAEWIPNRDMTKSLKRISCGLQILCKYQLPS